LGANLPAAPQHGGDVEALLLTSEAAVISRGAGAASKQQLLPKILAGLLSIP